MLMYSYSWYNSSNERTNLQRLIWPEFTVKNNWLVCKLMLNNHLCHGLRHTLPLELYRCSRFDHFVRQMQASNSYFVSFWSVIYERSFWGWLGLQLSYCISEMTWGSLRALKSKGMIYMALINRKGLKYRPHDWTSGCFSRSFKRLEAMPPWWED